MTYIQYIHVCCFLAHRTGKETDSKPWNDENTRCLRWWLMLQKMLRLLVYHESVIVLISSIGGGSPTKNLWIPRGLSFSKFSNKNPMRSWLLVRFVIRSNEKNIEKTIWKSDPCNSCTLVSMGTHVSLFFLGLWPIHDPFFWGPKTFLFPWVLGCIGWVYFHLLVHAWWIATKS